MKAQLEAIYNELGMGEDEKVGSILCGVEQDLLRIMEIAPAHFEHEERWLEFQEAIGAARKAANLAFVQFSVKDED